MQQPQTHSSGTSLTARWTEHLRSPAFRREYAGSVLLLVAILIFFTRFLGWVEVRRGAVLDDPILKMIEPYDFSWITFGIIYVAVVVAVVHLGQHPLWLLRAVQAYTLTVIVRILMMWAVPLDPPEGLIVLRDPVVQLVGNGESPTRDLFFSGHTATLFLFSLTAMTQRMKCVFLIFTILVAALVVWQHVHYVIDVLVAPFVAYASFRLVNDIRR